MNEKVQDVAVAVSLHLCQDLQVLQMKQHLHLKVLVLIVVMMSRQMEERRSDVCCGRKDNRHRGAYSNSTNNKNIKKDGNGNKVVVDKCGWIEKKRTHLTKNMVLFVNDICCGIIKRLM